MDATKDSTDEVANATKAARLYKSHMPYVRIMFGPDMEAVFHKGRFSTADEALIAKLDNLVKTDRAVGIYIDPNESETSQLPPGTDYALRQRQLEEFMRNQAVKVDAGNTATGTAVALNVSTTADSPTTGGKSAPAPRFTKEEVDALLKAKTTTPAPSGAASTAAK